MATLFLFIAIGFLVQDAVARSTSLCPLFGPDFPPPRTISQNPGFRNTVEAFSKTIQNELLGQGNSTYGPFDSTNNTFSVNIFSTFSEDPLFEYHYTAPLFANGTGTKKVDGDTIFRIGSISKLFTVFAFLIEKGDANFNDPITKYVPELAVNQSSGVVNAVQWDAVTIGALASQMAGIGRYYSGPRELAWLGESLVKVGFPPLDPSDVPTCGSGLPGVPLCDRAAFLKGFLARHPVFAPSTTPIYSNAAFQILAYALENVANKNNFSSIIYADILNPLHMARTSTSLPLNSSLGAIPSGTQSGWKLDIGDGAPTGGIYSTSNDLAKLGRAILKNTLLSPAQTRRWMKPVTHSSSLMFSVGAPWEIHRVDTPRGIVDLYTKGGSIGVYASMFVLVPDYNVGWAVLSAASLQDIAGAGLGVISNLITDAFIPAFEAAAKDEAAAVFAGEYKATDGLNSSITIATDDFPGLGIQNWVSNGTDAFATYLDSAGLTDPRFSLTIRLYPTNLLQDSPKQQAFRAVFEILPKPRTPHGTFSICGSWAGVDGITYGGVALDEFVFQFDESGMAVSLTPRIFRTTLHKL